MESVLKAAYSVLPMLNREELVQLQSRITDILREDSDMAGFFHPLTEADLEADLDASIAELDAGKGISREALDRSVRERYGW